MIFGFQWDTHSNSFLYRTNGMNRIRFNQGVALWVSHTIDIFAPPMCVLGDSKTSEPWVGVDQNGQSRPGFSEDGDKKACEGKKINIPRKCHVKEIQNQTYFSEVAHRVLNDSHLDEKYWNHFVAEFHHYMSHPPLPPRWIRPGVDSGESAQGRDKGRKRFPVWIEVSAHLNTNVRNRLKKKTGDNNSRRGQGGGEWAPFLKIYFSPTWAMVLLDVLMTQKFIENRFQGSVQLESRKKRTRGWECITKYRWYQIIDITKYRCVYIQLRVFANLFGGWRNAKDHWTKPERCNSLLIFARNDCDQQAPDDLRKTLVKNLREKGGKYQ